MFAQPLRESDQKPLGLRANEVPLWDVRSAMDLAFSTWQRVGQERHRRPALAGSKYLAMHPRPAIRIRATLYCEQHDARAG